MWSLGSVRCSVQKHLSVEPKYYTRLGASRLRPLLGFNIDARMIRTSSCGRIPNHVHRRSRRPATNPAVGIFWNDPYQVAAMNIIWVPTFVVRTVQQPNAMNPM